MFIKTGHIDVETQYEWYASNHQDKVNIHIQGARREGERYLLKLQSQLVLIKKSSLSFSLSSFPLHCMMSPSNNTYILYFL